MATVTITEILGGDNIAASRIVINNNFTILQNAVNTLETRLNTSYVPGGSLNIGDVQILKYNRAVTQNIFLLQGSGQIDGNLSLGTPTNAATLNITGLIQASQSLTVNEAVTFNNVPGTQAFVNSLQTITNDSHADEQWYPIATTKNPIVLTQSLLAPYVLPVTTSTSVLYLDVTAYTGVGPTNINIFQMPSVTAANDGQIVTLAFTGLSGANGTFEIDNSVNIDPAFNNAAIGANIIFNNTIANSSTDARFSGIWLTLVAGQGVEDVLQLRRAV